jgi:hypothetical protein
MSPKGNTDCSSTHNCPRVATFELEAVYKYRLNEEKKNEKNSQLVLDRRRESVWYWWPVFLYLTTILWEIKNIRQIRCLRWPFYRSGRYLGVPLDTGDVAG